MTLNMTKIAFRTKSLDELRGWVEREAEALMTTRYLPKRHEEMIGGSLYWIINHALVARSEILGFEQNAEGRWTIRLKGQLVAIQPKPKRAHQGWRYLAAEDAPADLAPGEVAGDMMPGKLLRKLSNMGLV